MEVWKIVKLSIRSLLLAIIVFGSITFIPQREIEIKNRIIASVVVVVIYILLDFIGDGLGWFGKFMCRMTCGCSGCECQDKTKLVLADDTSEVDLST
jgi:hypothetical protein